MKNEVSILVADGAVYDLFGLIAASGTSIDLLASIESAKVLSVYDNKLNYEFVADEPKYVEGSSNSTSGHKTVIISGEVPMGDDTCRIGMVIDLQRGVCSVTIYPADSIGLIVKLEVIQGNVNSIEMN